MHMARSLVAAARSIWRRGVALGGMLAFAWGCGSDGLEAPTQVAPDQLYWDLQLNHRAALLSTVAPYDTLTLIAIARNANGVSIAMPEAPTFTSGNVKRAIVTPEGVLRALSAGVEPAWIVARLTVGNLTHIDSLEVRVVDDVVPPVLTEFSIQPIAPDSAKWGGGPFSPFPSTVPLRATDASGVPLADLPVYYRSSDTTIATVDRNNGTIIGGRPGSVTLDASTTAFGVAKADALTYRIGWPIFEIINYQPIPTSSGENINGFLPATVTIGVGGMVQWGASEMLDVVFEDPTDLPSVARPSTYAVLPGLFDSAFCEANSYDCGGGDLSLSPTQSLGYRVFSAPGVYEIRSVQSGASGRVVVVDER